MRGDDGAFNQSYLYCVDTALGWGNRTYFTFFSQFNRGAQASVLGCLESAVLILIFLLSSVSNVVIFYSLASNRRLRTVTNYFVCNLTLSDVCFTVCCPLVAVVRVTGTWTLGSFACKTIVYLSCVCGFVSIWTLTLISIDRYICIVRTSQRRMRPSLALLLIAILWGATLAAFSPLLLYFGVKDCSFGSGRVFICTLGWPHSDSINIPVLFTGMACGVGFLLPIVILVISHVSIFVTVYRARLAMAQQRHRCYSTTSVLHATTSVLHATTPPSACPSHSRHTYHACQDSDNLMPPHGLLKNSLERLRSPPGIIPNPPAMHLHPNLPGILPKPPGVRTNPPRVQSTSPEAQTDPPQMPHNAPGALPNEPMAVPDRTSVHPPQHATLGAVTTPNTSTLDTRKRRNRRDLRLMKTLLLLVLLFFAMWAPIFVIILLIMRDANYDVMRVSSRSLLGAMCVAYSNAVLNPLAYGLGTDRLCLYLRHCVLCWHRLLGSRSSVKTPQGHKAAMADSGEEAKTGGQGVRHWIGKWLKSSAGTSVS